MKTKEKRLISLREAAKMLDVSKLTLYKWLRSEPPQVPLKAIKIGPGKRIKLERQKVLDYLESAINKNEDSHK